MDVDQTKLDALMGKLIGHMTGGMVCIGMQLGDELGLYREMAGSGRMTAESVAQKTGCHSRLVREWLDGQVAAGFVDYDADADTYELGPEAAMALADDASPVFVARAMNAFAGLFHDVPKLVAAFKGNGAMSWGEHHAGLFCGTEWFFRTGYRAMLTTTWIPALDGVEAKLKAGGRIADVGCGHGASAVVMAEAYPKSTVQGFDFHEPSIVTSRKRAHDAGVADRAKFEVATANTYTGKYDLICFFDSLHDMGDPVGIARYAREHLADGGTVLLVEPFAIDGRAKNVKDNPMAALLYLASACVCTPNSLSQEVGLGIGAQAGEARLRGIFEEAGFKRFRRAAETPMNLIFDVKA